MATRLLKYLNYALHAKYEPFSNLRTPSNRLLNYKMASNSLKISLQIFLRSTKEFSWNNKPLDTPTHTWASHKIWAQSVVRNPFKQAFKGQNSLKWPHKQPQSYVWGPFQIRGWKIWHIFYCISISNVPGLDIEWFNLTLKVKNEISQTFCGP